MALKYFDELKRTMEWVATLSGTLFLGQTVGGPGTFMFQTLRDVPSEKRLEMPINESFQMQFTIGMALAGHIPISVYPRQNFLLLAVADMVNMLDKIPAISGGAVCPRVVIRAAAGPFTPVHPGHQHVGNYADAFRAMFSWIDVVELENPEDIFPAYERALCRPDPRTTLMIEHGNYYHDK
jgi:pyruvate/2-oxoglutarate/acetoin dehydrogenase E1 component